MLFASYAHELWLSINVTLKRFLITIEVLLAVATLGFAGVWLFNPAGNWEPPIVICGTLAVIVDLVRRFRSGEQTKPRFETDGERIQHREKLRKEFQAEIYRCRAEKLREDVIIRHVDRVDNYPNTDSESGISPWFKVFLLDTYERGIVVGLRLGQLKKVDDGYRYVDYKNSEKGDISGCLLGNIPYDSIEAVNMDGDDYYYYPHIYCYFDFNGEPYERLWFAERIDRSHGHPFYKEIAEYSEVTANNPPESELYFG